MLKTATYNLLGIDGVIGRLFIGTPRAEDQLARIIDFLTITGIDAPRLKDIRSQISKLEAERDALVHGYWVKDRNSNALWLRDTAGKWNVPDGFPAIRKRIFPPAREVSRDGLARLVVEIDAVIDLLSDLNQDAVG